MTRSLLIGLASFATTTLIILGQYAAAGAIG
jgi:hypothetical protein